MRGNMAEGNSVLDEIRAQHHKMKDKTPKEKLLYFWEYYRIPTIVLIIAIAVVINLIYTVVTSKDTVFYVVLVNGYTDMDTAAYISGFEEYAQIDTKEYAMNMEANFTLDPDSMDQYAMANLQKFMALVASNELDVAIANEDAFLGYSESGYFRDLNEVFPKETLDALADRLLYFDVPDDEIDGEIPVGIRVTDTPLIAETGAYAAYGDAWFGVLVNSEHLENARLFLDYLEETSVASLEE